MRGAGNVNADGEIVAVLKLTVAANILYQHIIGVVLDTDRAFGISVHGDVADRQSRDCRAGIRPRDHIVEEARDVRRVDMLDRQVAHVCPDAKGRADILEGNVAEAEIVGAAQQPEDFLSRGIGRIEWFNPRTGNRCRHRIARAVHAADRYRRARRPSPDDRERPGRRDIVTLIGEQKHLPARPRRRDELRQIFQRRSVRSA